MGKKWTCLAYAGVAGALVALIGCGNDPSAAGASGTRPPFGGARDGGNGTDDGNTGGPNPLIAKIPGFWYGEMFEGHPNPELQRDMEDPDEVLVDTDDPTCANYLQTIPGTLTTDQERNAWTNLNPPGDACIRPPRWGLGGLETMPYIILDGDDVRKSIFTEEYRMLDVYCGTVTEDGRTIDVTHAITFDGRTSTFPPSRFRKIR